MTLSIKKKTLRKVVSSLTMLATVVSMSGIMALSSVSIASAAVVNGSIIKSNATNPDGTPTIGSLDVYIVKLVGTKKFKRLILNPTVFTSYGHLNWGNIQTVSQAVMDEYTTSSLVRVDGAEKVYAMAPDGDIGSKSWVNLTSTEFLGVTGSDADAIYTINAVDGGNYTAVSDVTTTTELATFYSAGTLPGVVPVPAGSLTVALSATTPASSTLIVNQANAHLADFTLTGTGTVTGVTLKRVGVSQDSTLASVYLFDGDTRLTDAASVSSGNVNFTNSSGIFEVNGTKIISVKSTLAGTAGETVGVQLTGATLVSGSATGFPVSSNTHSIASATLASVAVGTPTPSSAATTDPEIGVRVWQSTFTIGTRDVVLSKLALRQINSIESKDIKNFKLLVDGVEVATKDTLDTNGYVTFSGFEKTLKTGTKVVKVTADVIGGSSRIIQMSLRNTADIDVVDSQYGVSIAATGTPASTSTLTVNSGSITVEKASDSPSGNVTDAASNLKIAKYTFTAYGEAIKVETLLVDFTHVTSGDVAETSTLRNGIVMVDGSQVGSTTTLNPASTGTSFTTNFVVTPGAPRIVEVYADMFDNDGTNAISAGDKITVTLSTGSANGSRQVSLGTVNVPSANVSANQVVIGTTSMGLAVTASYPAQTTVVPRTAYKMGSWNLTGSSIEDVNVTNFSIDIDEVTNTTFSEADLSNLYITYGGITSTVKATASATDNDWSASYTLVKNATVTVELYATIGSTVTAGDSVKTDLSVTSTGANSGTDTTQSDVDGQTITYQAGTIVATRDASTPSAALLDDSGTVKTASFKFEATYDNYSITEVVVAVTNATAVANVILKDGTTVLATKPGATAVTFSGLSVPVANNASKIIDVYVELSAVGFGAGTSGSAVTTDFTSAKALPGSTGIEATVTDSTTSGNAMYVYKAIPVITNATLPSAVLGTGTKTISKFTIASSGGTIAWKQVLLDITKTATPTLASYALYDVTSGSAVAVTAAIVVQNDTVANSACDGADTSCELLISVGTNADDNVEEQVSGSKTYEVRATIGGAVATNDYVNTNIAQNLAHVSSAVYTSVDNDTTVDDATFVWSDVSALSHDTGTADWTNDNLVKNLATETQNLVK